MTPTTFDPAGDDLRDWPSSGPIRCAKCKAQNSGESGECSSCGAHLYITCRSCGQRAPRYLSDCPECRRPFRISRRQRLWRRLRRMSPDRRARYIRLAVTLLVVAMIGVVFVRWLLNVPSSPPD